MKNGKNRPRSPKGGITFFWPIDLFLAFLISGGYVISCVSIDYVCKSKRENVDHRYLEVSGEKPNFAPSN